MLSPAGGGFRTDVEGLRAVAVILVVAFHAGVPHLDGGFIGVDVFFVLSGYLITRLMLAERERTGTISLMGFWSRRARRLLPAACLTLVTTLVVAQFVLPPLQRRSVTIDALFSSVFLANVRFARSLGDYFGGQLAEAYPSPFLHYWSLAVEEQFYVVWPLVVLAATRIGRRPRVSLAVVAGSIAIASFAVSVWWTPRQPESAFYLLPARMCELLAGALLAIVGSASLGRIPGAVRAGLGWLGLIGIVVATVTYSEASAFPGYLALLPVLATVAVLVAGAGDRAPFGPGRLLELRTLQWIGGISYALYLWHWPALVLAQAHDPTGSALQRAGAVAVSVVLAALSMRLVENPVRYAKALSAPPVRGLALGLGLTAVSIAVIGVSWSRQPALGTDEAAPVVSLVPVPETMPPATDDDLSADSSGASPATGSSESTSVPTEADDTLQVLERQMAAILDEAAGTTDVPSNLRPSLASASDDLAQVYRDGCITLGESREVLDCRYGAVGSDETIVLFGDSHAAHWFPAVEQIADDRNVELVTILKGGCPVADVPSTRADLIETCPPWRTAAIDAIAAIEPDLVVVSSLSGYTTDEAAWERGLTEVLGALGVSADRVVVMLDTPRPNGAPPVCLSENLKSADDCLAQRVVAVQAGRIASEQAAATATGTQIIDPTPWMCGPTVCPVIVGDVLMYRDINHITTTASELLAPLLDAALFPSSQ